MNKDSFLVLTKDFASASSDNAKKLLSLQKQYPYSQVIRSLTARATRDFDLDPQQQHLHICAVYATDRAVLKWVMTTVAEEVKETVKDETQPVDIAPATSMAVESAIAEKEPESNPKPAVATHFSTTLSGDDLIDQIFIDLKTLKKLKHNFEVSIEKFEKRQEQQALIPETDVFIDEIRSTRKKIKSDDGKQREQIEIIDQFIKIQPSISANPKSVTEAVDLSEKSLAHTDKFVSETLVEILMKQGKKEKAIEVLKKLIWKFPQKKAYFAARIDELRK